MKNKLCVLSIIAAAALTVFAAADNNGIGNVLAQSFSAEVSAADLVKLNGVTYAEADGGFGVSDSDNSVTDLVIPATINGKPVVQINAGAFNGNSNIKSVSIPSSVKFIGGGAFRSCTSLETVTMECELDTIWSGTFAGCKKLKTINIPSSVTVIGDYAFENAGIETIELPANLKTIEMDAFYGCSSLKEIAIPKTVTTIGGYAFSDCKSLTSIAIPGTMNMNLSEITGEYEGDTGCFFSAFDNCTGLKEVSFGGDAPAYNPFILAGIENLTVYYINGKSGWSDIKNLWTDSYAQTYTFIGKDSAFDKGDVDANGIVTTGDVAQMLKKITNSSYVTGIEKMSGTKLLDQADINGDGYLTILDPVNLMKNKNLS